MAKYVSDQGALTQALIAALKGKWAEVEPLLSATDKSPPVRFIRELASHGLRGAPDRATLDESLGRFFVSQSPTLREGWSAQDLVNRLSYLAAYGRLLEPGKTGAELVHSLRRFNAHLTEPPARNLFPPPEVVAAAEKLEAVLAAAQDAGRGLRIEGNREGFVYQVAEGLHPQGGGHES